MDNELDVPWRHCMAFLTGSDWESFVVTSVLSKESSACRRSVKVRSCFMWLININIYISASSLRNCLLGEVTSLLHIHFSQSVSVLHWRLAFLTDVPLHKQSYFLIGTRSQDNRTSQCNANWMIHAIIICQVSSDALVTHVNTGRRDETPREKSWSLILHLLTPESLLPDWSLLLRLAPPRGEFGRSSSSQNKMNLFLRRRASVSCK